MVGGRWKALIYAVLYTYYIVYDLGSNLPFMIHVEESTYKLIYSMFGSDFDPYSEKKGQEKQNTTGNCD